MSCFLFFSVFHHSVLFRRLVLPSTHCLTFLPLIGSFIGDDQVSAAGLLVCLVVSFLATDFFPVKQEKDIEWVRNSERLRHVLLDVIFYICLCFVDTGKCMSMYVACASLPRRMGFLVT